MDNFPGVPKLSTRGEAGTPKEVHLTFRGRQYNLELDNDGLSKVTLRRREDPVREVTLSDAQINEELSRWKGISYHSPDNWRGNFDPAIDGVGVNEKK